MASLFLNSFLEGFTGGDLFGSARMPGVPTKLFAEVEGEVPNPELLALLIKEQAEDAVEERAALCEISAMDNQAILDALRKAKVFVGFRTQQGEGPDGPENSAVAIATQAKRLEDAETFRQWAKHRLTEEPDTTLTASSVFKSTVSEKAKRKHGG